MKLITTKNRNLVQNIIPSKQMKKKTYTKQHVTSTKNQSNEIIH